MGDKKEYEPDVYRRLELVQKQFQTNRKEERKLRAEERRREWREQIVKNRTRISRIALYAVLGLVLLAVILVVIFDKL